MRTIEDKHGLSGDDEPPDDTPPGTDRPKRDRAFITVPVALLVGLIGLAFFAWGVPIMEGFHFGCNVLAGDTVRTTRLGVEMCRGEDQAEVREKREPAEEKHQATEKRGAEERGAEQQSNAPSEGKEQAAQEAKTPKLEERASSLRTEAASLHAKQQHEEALRTEDEAAASRIASEEPAEGGEGKKNIEADERRDEGYTHGDEADSLKLEAESKTSEAQHYEGKASER
jgi:hypothetical protein